LLVAVDQPSTKIISWLDALDLATRGCVFSWCDPTSSDSEAVFPAAADGRSLLWLTRGGRERYAVETMALCLDLRLLLLPRKGE
jgi:hypothetical protein